MNGDQHDRIKHHVSYVLENAATLDDALGGVLRAVGEGMQWTLGLHWAKDTEAGTLRFRQAWSTDDQPTSTYIDESEPLAFVPGLGLPGVTWGQRDVVWIADVSRVEWFTRRSMAIQAGMHSALSFPVIVGGDVIGVLEFLSPDIREPDAALYNLVSSIGGQVSRFLDRARANADVRESESRQRAVLDTALDAMIQMDHLGVIREFNPAATEMFGYSREQAVGEDLATLLIPPRLRQRHRDGLGGYVQTGEGTVSGGRFETVAMRSDGTEFPVEVSVAPIVATGPPSFNGFVRDITARKRAEEQARFLVNAGELLAASLDYEQTLASVASLSTPFFADWCIVDLVSPDGEVQRIAAAHASPELEPMLVEMTRRYPPEPHRPHPAIEVARTGQSKLIEQVDELVWEQIAHDAAHLSMLEVLRPRSGLTVPLVARERVIGAIEFVRADSRRGFDEADVALGEEVARRAAVAVDNARLFHAAQEALREREDALALLETVLATAPVGIVFVDGKKRVVRINDVLAQLGGETASALAGLDMSAAIPAMAGTLDPLVDRALATGEPLLESELVTGASDSRQETRHWLASVYPVRNASGEVAGVGAIVTEFTSRRHAEERLRFLAEASAILADSLDYEATLSSVARLAVPHLADWCIVYLLAEDGSVRRLAMEQAIGTPDEVTTLLHEEVGIDPRAASGVPEVIRSGRSLLLPEASPADLAADTTDPARMEEVTLPLDLKSWMCVPLTVRGETIGAMSFISGSAGRRYTEIDLSLAEDIGRRAAVAVENARLFRAEQQTRQFAERVAEQTSQLQTVTSALSRSLTQEEVAEVIVELGVATLGAHRGMLALLQDDGETLLVARGVGYPEAFRDAWRVYRLDASTPQTEVIRSRAPLFLESREARAERFPHLERERNLIGGGAVASIPLTIGERALGALTLGFGEERRFDASDRAFLMALGHQCAQALERARLYGEEQRNREEAERSREMAARQAHLQRLLSEASRAFAEASLDLRQVVDTVALHASGTLDAYAAVYLPRDEDGVLARGAARDASGAAPDIDAIVDGAILETRSELVRDALRGSRPTGINTAMEDTQRAVFAKSSAAAEEAGVSGLLIAPLRTHGSLMGVIVAVRRGGSPDFTPDDMDLLTDLSSRAALAIENARLYRQAQEAVHAREQFLSIASHELRTPLTTVKASAQLLGRRFRRGDTNTDRSLALLGQLEEEVGRLETLVEDLLDATQIQRGRLELTRERFDLSELARRCLERFDQPMHRSEQHMLLFESGGPIVGNWDALRLDQVITNLISNAVKYSPDGGRVVVGTRLDGDYAELWVSDEGIGIPPDEQEDLFQPFQRGAEARRSIGGTGLGLFITAEIVQRHGGTIAVESEAGAGSTFTVRLPIDVDATQEDAAHGEVPAASLPQGE